MIAWVATLFGLGGARGAQVHVHHVCALPRELAAVLRSLGVQTHAVEPFSPHLPHTNKIRQWTTPFPAASRVVLTDVDLAFVEPLPIASIGAAVAGKPVDRPNPPLPVLRRIFEHAARPVPDVIRCRYRDAAGQLFVYETLSGNFNGGLYIIDAACLRPIGEAWSRWARWLIERIHLLERWNVHVDQVAFCLAVNEVGPDVELLTDRWNFPLHLPCVDREVVPYVLHHHAAFDADAYLRPGALAHAPEPVSRVNAVIREFRRTHALGSRLSEELP